MVRKRQQAVNGEFLVGEPVTKREIPRTKWAQYLDIWEKVIAADGAWVPVTCPSVEGRKRLQTSVTSNRRFYGATRSVGLVLYIRSLGLRPQRLAPERPGR